MAASVRKFSDKLNIDCDLSTEGVDNELSLADDGDEFSGSFSGQLSLIEANNVSDSSGLSDSGEYQKYFLQWGWGVLVKL